jgi:hypothetical protein
MSKRPPDIGCRRAGTGPECARAILALGVAAGVTRLDGGARPRKRAQNRLTKKVGWPVDKALFAMTDIRFN